MATLLLALVQCQDRGEGFQTLGALTRAEASGEHHLMGELFPPATWLARLPLAAQEHLRLFCDRAARATGPGDA